MSQADANVGFTLTTEARTRLVQVLDRFADALPQASALLTDLAGRIVEIARKPVGVKLEEIAALASACHASTHRLASAMDEDDFAMVFQHEDERQVCVWPVAGRALLVVLLKGLGALDQLESRLEGPLGSELATVVREAREPLRSVPPPRIDPAEVPAPVITAMRNLTAFIMEQQALHPLDFTPAISSSLLRAREDLARAIGGQDWPRANEICRATHDWLARVMPAARR